MLEDRFLLRQLNSGNRDALCQIYKKYRTDLFTIAVSLLGDWHLAEDCLQDVFVHLAETVGRIRIRSNLKGYLVSAVVNKARDSLRRKARRNDRTVEELTFEKTIPEPGQALTSHEQTLGLLQAITRLPLEQREVFVLHTQGVLSFRQIARKQEISVQTAYSRYRYAVNKLRQLL